MAVTIEDIKKLRAMTGAGLADVKNALNEAQGDFDKAKETGLVPVTTESGCVTFEQARLTLECRKRSKSCIKPEDFIDKSIEQWYGGAKGGYHDVYVLEIVGAYAG